MLLFAVMFIGSVNVAAQSISELSKGWHCIPVSGLNISGEELSKVERSLPGDWMPAVVPGTVLTTLLHNKKVPDPFYGMNNELIPDIYDKGAAYYTYWFVNEFSEKAPSGDEQVFLNLRGVNYSCDIFLNGTKVNGERHYGMFLRQSYNVTRYLAKNGKNRLAIIVYPPDPVGNANGGQGGDGTIAKSVTHQYVAGWDWIQPIRDRNTGLWDKITLERTGAVNIRNTHIVTRVPGIRMPGTKQQPATLIVSAELENALDRPVEGTISYLLDGREVRQKVSLAARESRKVSMPDHQIQNPRLWWPSGYGKQETYQLILRFAMGDRKVSDRDTSSFGVRELQTSWNATTASRQVSVNGQKIFIKGGNWIVSDQMLRLSRERYDAEVRFHRDMNLNLIRVWGGALLERPEFYEACDRYGILVFQDFWMTGDCNGRWNDRMKKDDRETRRKYPDDHELFLRSARDQVKMIRNHPSLAIWCGGNEITPPEDILSALRDTILPELDGTRWFVDASTSDSMSLNTIGGGGDGPYNIQPKDTFWQHRTYPFNSEVGSVGVGDYASLQRFIPEQNLVAPIYNDTARGRNTEIVDSVWRYHKYIGYSKYILPYGKPVDARDFAEKAQLVNYDQYRSLIEGFSSRMWEWYTGVIIWKTQNPWTALRGQMYDYYLDPNACLYGLRNGSETVHIMYNPLDGRIMFTNNGFQKVQGHGYRATVYDISGKALPAGNGSIDIEPSSTASAGSILSVVQQNQAARGCFLQLELTNAKGNIVSRNFYWFPDSTGNYSGLQQMKKSKPNMKLSSNGAGKTVVTISNDPGSPVAFFNRISIVDTETRQRVLPAFFSDNYISIPPGQQRRIEVDHPAKAGLLVHLSGMNVDDQFVEIK